MRYDVIVAGGGPAGSTTARECALRGLSVLLLDKASFPRDKPCGGGITLRAARLLPFDLAPVIERTISGLDLTFTGRAGFARDAAAPLFYLVQRSRFDHFLVEQAVGAGVTLRERSPIGEIEQYPSHVVVRGRTETFEGKTLVAADGAGGQAARRVGLSTEKWGIVALEGNITPDRSFPERWASRVGIGLGSIPGGYHWLFPKGDHVNIGVGGLPQIGSTLRERLASAVGGYGFDPARLWGVRAAPIPVRRPGSPLVRGNLLLVGDAAGLVDPLTGEGIYGAVWSGRAAAKQLARYLSGEAPDLQGYREEVERELIPELQIAFQMWAFFHLAPALAANVLWRRATGKISRLIGWERFCRLIRGENRYRDLRNDFGPFWSPVDLAVRPLLLPVMSKIFHLLER